MTQSEINDAVSKVTGEDINEIQTRGFNLVSDFPSEDFDIEDSAMPDPQVLDFDSPFSGATQSVYESCC